MLAARRITPRPITTLADVVAASSLTRDALLVVSASLVTGLMAQVAFPLPWTPVPVTLQPLAVFVIGAALGSKRAALAMLAYLAEGAAGLPFFAGGAAGPGVLLGPTGGYLFGFVAAAFVIGFLAERGWDRSPGRAFGAIAAGTVLLYVCGLAQLSFFVPRERLLDAGLLPFLPGALLKMAAAALLLPAIWSLLRRTGLLPHDSETPHGA